MRIVVATAQYSHYRARQLLRACREHTGALRSPDAAMQGAQLLAIFRIQLREIVSTFTETVRQDIRKQVTELDA